MNVNILASSSVPFILTTVQVLNLPLTHKKWITVWCICIWQPLLKTCKISAGPDDCTGIPKAWVYITELEFLKSLWGLGTEEEEGYRTGPPGYIGWRNSFLGIDSGAPYTFKNTGSEYKYRVKMKCWESIRPLSWNAHCNFVRDGNRPKRWFFHHDGMYAIKRPLPLCVCVLCDLRLLSRDPYPHKIC